MSRMPLTGLFTASTVLLVGQQLAARPLFTHTPASAESPLGTPGLDTPADAPPCTTTSLLAATQPGDTVPPSPGQPAQTILTRNETGSFNLTAQVNNRPASFVVDTGADLVSLTEADAHRLGLPVDAGKMRPLLRTADGLANAQMLTIPTLTIGGQVMRDVPAVVVPGLQVNLLGESALGRLRQVILSGNHMVIEPA